MKKILTIISLFSFAFLFAQHEVGKKILELEKQKTIFKPFSVLNVVQKATDNNLNKVVANATIATIKANVVNDIVSNKYQNIELAIPYNGKIVTVDLYQVNLLAEGFHIDTDKQKNISYQKGVYYRGIVKGDYTSIASFNFFNNEFNGIISNNELSNLVVGKLDKANNKTDYIIYADANLKVLNDSQCSLKVDESAAVDLPMDSNKSVTSARCVTVYFEIDYDLFTNNNNSTTNTSNWMTSVFNNVQTLYNNDGITVALKSIYIWTSLDPYDGIGTTSTAYLYKFNEVRPVFDGDVGQLVGIDAGGLGGVAVVTNGLCSQDNFSYSDVNIGYLTVPTYSWTVEVITHELGHLLGSPHTHRCVWNGNNTAIDNCAGVALGTSAEGYSCMTNPPTLPSTTEKGTIMSYCHLVSGVGISFSNGFGPQPAARILSAVNGSTCLSTDCITTCINNITSVSIDNVTTTTATISWVDAGTSFTSWQVAVYPLGGTATNWITVNTVSSYSAVNLTANSYYVVEVRPNCDAGLVSGTKTIMFVTASDFCNGLVFADTGGTSSNYADMETVVRTIVPNVPNNNIVLTFSEFNFEQDYDFLSVYNGNTTAATLLGKFTGTTIPGPFTSSAADGSLTVKYTSDQFLNFSGFVANISCTPNLSVNNYNGYIDFSYYPNPTNGKVMITSKTPIAEVLVYNVTGQLLYDSQLNDLNTNVDITSYAVGTYFFKLKFDGDKEANFKVMRE
jgi:hypothetical protein